MVRRIAGDGATVSITGAIGGQGIFAIERPTRTLTAMLARAGGVTVEPEIARVKVIRGKHTGEIWFQDLFEEPSFDIALRGGDRILVEADTRSFTALGATGQQNRVRFDTQTLSAVEAIAQVGGLNSQTADPTGVFVFRNEPEEIVLQVLGRTDLIGTQRMVYVLDLTEPNGVFLARDFVIRDGDTVYITEAPFVQWSKTLAALTGTLNAGTGLAGSVNTLSGN
jgi:polysaccharide biosynthesis/export protein